MAEGEPQTTGQTKLPDLTAKYRKASFNMYEILAPDFPRGEQTPGRVLRWEAEGQKNNPNGEILPLTIDRVNELARRRNIPQSET